MPCYVCPDAACQQQELEEDIHISFNFPAKAAASVPADDITFLATAAALPDRATSSSPDPFAPRTPDQSPTNLPPCQVNPMSKFQKLLPSQEEGQQQPVSSFHQLLVSQQLDEQDRLNKFQELLASQELSKDGKPLTSLAGRVHTMAAQLDVLQKRTKVNLSHSYSIQWTPKSCLRLHVGYHTTDHTTLL